jgi:hypothetical protein
MGLPDHRRQAASFRHATGIGRARTKPKRAASRSQAQHTNAIRKILLNMSTNIGRRHALFPCRGHDSVPFEHHVHAQRCDKIREEKMSVKKIEAQRERAKAALLAKHYRAIGPAAIVAALICARKKPAKPAGAKAA